MKHVAAMLALAFATLSLVAPSVAADGPLPPEAPAWIDATYQDVDQSVWLTWGSVESAASYNVYRDGDLIATLATPSYLDADLPLNAVTYRVTAVTDGVESAPATAVITESAVTGNAALFLSAATPGPFVQAQAFGMQACIPVGIGGGPPYVDIDWSCLQP